MATSTQSPSRGSPRDDPSKLGVPPVRTRARSPSQRFPSTALFVHSRNNSRLNVESPRDNNEPTQRLPRPEAPPSLSGPSVRPSVINPQVSTASTIASQPGSPFASRQPNSANETSPAQPNSNPNFNPDSIWTTMQATIADVELSALNHTSSSHIFGASHSKALEDLRRAQLNLAQAWARSEAEDVDPESDNEGFGNAMGKSTNLTSNPKKNGEGAGSRDEDRGRKEQKGRSYSAGSTNSTAARDLEADTDRDIQMARKRREANDRYFEQVSKGVLDVVAKLDEVASAMRQVEIESRDVWKDGSITSASTFRTGREDGKRDDRGSSPEPDSSVDEDMLQKFVTRTSTDAGTVSDALSDTPVTPKKG